MDGTIVFEDGWRGIKVILDLLYVKAEIQNEKILSNREFVDGYILVYNMSTQKSPFNWSERLYRQSSDSMQSYLRAHFLPVLEKEEVHPLQYVIAFYTRYKIFLQVCRGFTRVFSYLNRYHVKYAQLPTIEDSCLKNFEEVVLVSVREKLKTALVRTIDLKARRQLLLSANEEILFADCLQLYCNICIQPNTLMHQLHDNVKGFLVVLTDVDNVHSKITPTPSFVDSREFLTSVLKDIGGIQETSDASATATIPVADNVITTHTIHTRVLVPEDYLMELKDRFVQQLRVHPNDPIALTKHIQCFYEILQEFEVQLKEYVSNNLIAVADVMSNIEQALLQTAESSNWVEECLGLVHLSDVILIDNDSDIVNGNESLFYSACQGMLQVLSFLVPSAIKKFVFQSVLLDKGQRDVQGRVEAFIASSCSATQQEGQNDNKMISKRKQDADYQWNQIQIIQIVFDIVQELRRLVRSFLLPKLNNILPNNTGCDDTVQYLGDLLPFAKEYRSICNTIFIDAITLYASKTGISMERSLWYEALGLHLHQLLSTTSLSNAEEDMFEKNILPVWCFSFFQSIQEKDLFVHIHAYYLSKRLLEGKLRSIEYEQIVLAHMKGVFGVLLSAKIDRMIGEYILNKETLTPNFSVWMRNNTSSCSITIPEFTVQTFHELTWVSFLSNPSNMNHLSLPPSSAQGKLLADCKAAYLSYYTQHYSSSTVSVPAVIPQQNLIANRFQSSRKICWNHCLGAVTLKVFPHNSIIGTNKKEEGKDERAILELQMLPIQAMVLLCFAPDMFHITSVVSFESICKTLNGHWEAPTRTGDESEKVDKGEEDDEEEVVVSMDMILLQRVLHSLCYTKYPVLKKKKKEALSSSTTTATNTVEKKIIHFQDSFGLNMDFFSSFFPSTASSFISKSSISTNKMKSIALPKPIFEDTTKSAVQRYEEDENGTGMASLLMNTKTKAKMHQQMDSERAMVIEATIVRLMKSLKSMEHTELVVDVIRHITIFPVDPKVVKKRVESLLDREYLQRDVDNVHMYHYVA